MAHNQTHQTKITRERAFLVGVNINSQENLLTTEDSLDELKLLSNTAGLDVIGQSIQNLKRPNPKTLIGSGKVEEISLLAEDKAAELIIFDDELSPRHQRELEAVFGDKIQVIDRTALILDIFAQHAKTKEGSLQVELAQYEYRLPRLTRAWTHLARQAGGGGGRSVGGVGLRGPGETQLEVDRREINRRIVNLRNELERVRAHRQRYRTRRKKSNIPTVALVGYTNAGKSTLLNRLADADIYVADQLFATLDPTTRRIELPNKNSILLTDTVGFIQKLPTTLVAAFKATLEEIAEANLLLHVLDINHPNVQAQAQAVHQTLTEIEASHIPVITVMNKIDLLDNPQIAKSSLQDLENAVGISALKGLGINELLVAIQQSLFENYVMIDVFLPFTEGRLISILHEYGQIHRIEHLENGMKIQGKIPGRLVSNYNNFINQD